jgi:hypothetical protein
MYHRVMLFRVFLLFVVVPCWIGIVSAQQAPSAGESQGSPSIKDKLTPSAIADQPRKSPGENNDTLETQKLRAEIEKLRIEVESLHITNEALDLRTRRVSTWLGAFGGIAGAIIGAAGLLGLGLGLNRTQKSKLEQERVLGREKHNMELFQNLGHESLRVQLAAASVLIQRLEGFRSARLSPAEQLEKRTIIQVLIAVTKKNTEGAPAPSETQLPLSEVFQVPKKNAEDARTHPALLKLIADNLVKAMNAVEDSEDKKKKLQGTRSSPLKEFDFQKVQFPNAWWKGINARGVDFFRADLSHAGLANALLEGATLYEVNFRGSVLREADLREADLRKADLRDADLSGAKLEGAKFDGAQVAGINLTEASFGNNPDGQVDLSPKGDGSEKIPVRDWLHHERSNTCGG